MPVPFEALLPYGIMLVMFGISGAGLAGLRVWNNNGKRPRYDTDQWDRQMMRRDLRLTGKFRDQTDNPRAPFGYELGSRLVLERKLH